MLYLYLALLFGMIWWVADKELKEKFNKPLKYISLVFILIIAMVDVFMFIETERLVYANSNSNGTGIDYIYQTLNCPTSMNLVSGINISGNINSFCNNGNPYIVQFNGNVTDLNLVNNYNINMSNNIIIDYKSNDTSNDTYLQYYNGAIWITLYNLIYVTNYTIVQIPTNVSFNSVRLYDVSAGSQGTLYISELELQSNKITNIYGKTSLDTATIVGYHYSEYYVMDLISSMLPEIAMAIIFLAVVQYLLLLYNDVYGKR